MLEHEIPTTTKVTMDAGGNWLTIETRRVPAGSGEQELPADGSASLLEAVHRARVNLALQRLEGRAFGREAYLTSDTAEDTLRLLRAL